MGLPGTRRCRRVANSLLPFDSRAAKISQAVTSMRVPQKENVSSGGILPIESFEAPCAQVYPVEYMQVNARGEKAQQADEADCDARQYVAQVRDAQQPFTDNQRGDGDDSYR